jgi:hypothetical protein
LIAFEVVAVPKECGRESRLSELGECFDEGRRRSWAKSGIKMV